MCAWDTVTAEASMTNFQTFLTTVISASQISAGNLQARGFAAVILAIGLILILFQRGQS